MIRDVLAYVAKSLSAFTVPLMRFTVRRISFALPLLLACRGAAISPASEMALGEPAQLTVGQSVAVLGTPLHLRLNAISDSRCPQGAACIWQGEAATVLTLTGAGTTRTDTLKLNTAPKTVAYGDYRITLVDVLPVPRVSPVSQDSVQKSATITVSVP
jgi:hypothetical protein